jgi:hypothetical protein
MGRAACPKMADGAKSPRGRSRLRAHSTRPWRFGSLDIVINNASAISLSLVAQTDMKRFDLMHGEGAKPAHPDAIPATRHGGKMVCAHTGYKSYPHGGVNLELPIERTTLLWFDPTRRPAWLPAL